MSSSFNAKFKHQYEKDVLKNRHKTLRNLYRSIKNLLDQPGFSWNEKQRMVTACNDVWDEYVKVHPSARSFRIKTIPYYRDLCLIYSNAPSDGNSCHLKSPTTSINDGGDGNDLPESSSHSGSNKVLAIGQQGAVEAVMDPVHESRAGESCGPSASEGNMDYTSEATPNVATSTVGYHRTRTSWQPPMDCFFIDLLLEHVRKGNQNQGLFRKEAWMEMIALFNAKFEFNYDVEILKNRYKTLRRQYNVIKGLLELDGFAWDDSRQMVTAADFVWQDYIKAHKDVRQYMIRPIPYFKELCVICRDLGGVVGKESFSPQSSETEEVRESSFNVALRNFQSLAASACPEDPLQMELDSFDRDLKNLLSDKEAKQLQEKGPLSEPGRNDDRMVSAIREMAMAVSSISSNQKRNEEGPGCFSVEHVLEAVQALPDMDEDLVLDACDFLEDDRKAKMFLALDVKLRKKWLLRKLRANNS